MILCSRILRAIVITASDAVIGTGSIAAIAPSAAAATGTQFTASRSASHSPSQPFVAECQGDVYNVTETRSGEHKYVDFDTWVECIAVGVGIDEIISWIRLEFYFNGPSGRGQWLPVTGWRERYFAGAN
jgi:hypothetical protein